MRWLRQRYLRDALRGALRGAEALASRGPARCRRCCRPGAQPPTCTAPAAVHPGADLEGRSGAPEADALSPAFPSSCALLSTAPAWQDLTSFGSEASCRVSACGCPPVPRSPSAATITPAGCPSHMRGGRGVLVHSARHARATPISGSGRRPRCHRLPPFRPHPAPCCCPALSRHPRPGRGGCLCQVRPAAQLLGGA